ncbi:MAG: class I SAM-dependent methyltransferase [Acidimicrobiales bacterium]
MVNASHWDTVHALPAHERSWYQREPEVSLRLIESVATRESAVIDVGAGRSILADRLIARGFGDVTVLDLSRVALDALRSRLGHAVAYVNADVTAWEPTRCYDAWHDRATFHFLGDGDERRRYAASAAAALRPGGHAVIGAFSPDGPTACSGLSVERYSPDALADAFEDDFTPVAVEREAHVTPGGETQWFTWVVLKRTGS